MYHGWLENKLVDLSSELRSEVIDMKQFKLIKKIGDGAYGNVHLVEHKRSGKIVCAKILQIEYLDHDAKELFCREVNILSECDSPFLLSLIGYTIHRPLTILTPYAPKGCLYKYVSQTSTHKRLSSTRLTVIAMGIAFAMRTLHENHIVHRDLKSPNILLDDNYLPYVADFGLARSIDKARSKSVPMTMEVGTKPWMAPEIFTTGIYSEKVDVYSYAMLLYEMLMNRIPFSKENPKNLWKAVNDGQRPKLPKKENSLICELIINCWEQDPNDRPSFKEIFRQFCGHNVYFDGADMDCIRSVLKYIEKSGGYLRQADIECFGQSLSK